MYANDFISRNFPGYGDLEKKFREVRIRVRVRVRVRVRGVLAL